VLTILHDAIYKRSYTPPLTEAEADDSESGKSAVGINERGKFVRVSKDVRHRAIVGVTGAGKTTLAQTLKEVDLHRKRKVVEIEPSLEAKCEGIFMNLPNSDPEMAKILRRDFDLEPRPYKTIAYTPPTPQYLDFIEEYPEMERYFRPIRFTEDEMKQVLVKILPGGPIERMLLKTYLEMFADEPLENLIEYLADEDNKEVPGYMKATASKIMYIASLGVISDEGVSLKKVLSGNHASIITFAFVEDPLDRFMCSLIYLTAIYETWKEMPHSRILSFYVADANLFAASRNRDLLDSLSRYQQRARAQLQIYSRISRAQRVAWTLDFQSWQDIDPIVLEQMTERFFKRTWSEEVAKMLGLEQHELRRLGKSYAYFHNMQYLQKIKIRPPMSRKAREGQFTPLDFVKELRRFEDEEATFDI
jgi:energy-coupling factor transporter ATP-binding protein EcfA2